MGIEFDGDLVAGIACCMVWVGPEINDPIYC